MQGVAPRLLPPPPLPSFRPGLAAALPLEAQPIPSRRLQRPGPRRIIYVFISSPWAAAGFDNGARIAAQVGSKARGNIAGFILLSYPLLVRHAAPALSAALGSHAGAQPPTLPATVLGAACCPRHCSWLAPCLPHVYFTPNPPNSSHPPTPPAAGPLPAAAQAEDGRLPARRLQGPPAQAHQAHAVHLRRV